MYYKYVYNTPTIFSNIIMKSDGQMLTELSFLSSQNGQKNDLVVEELCIEPRREFEEAISWLDIYFSGENPNFTPSYKIEGATDFRKEVIEVMLRVPYGKSTTYNAIAKLIAQNRRMEKMAAQAVGGAVGWNPISIIIPCHRVLGSGGAITGYGGGIQNKIELLKLEGNSDFNL